MVAVVTSNLPDFFRQLRAMEKKVATRATRRATSAAGAVFRRYAKQEAPIKTGVLKRAVYLSRLKRVGRGEVGYRVKIRSGKSARKGADAYYAPWVIFGHLVRQPGGRLRGGVNSRRLQRKRLVAGGAARTKENPFIDRAFRVGQSDALATFNRRMADEIRRVDAES